MKSRTSSCKAAAFRKNLSRFWPVWVGYILCLVMFQIIVSNDDLTYWYAANLGECISVMGLVNCGYALIVAQMLFGDLFNPRMCNGLHSLPLTRQQWFSAHIKAGFLFSIVPTALMAGFSEIIIDLYSTMVNGWQIPLYWFAASNIQYIFFFGLAVFSVMCTGTRFAMTVIYGMINFFSSLIYVLVYQIYTPLLYGVVSQSEPFELLGPVVQITSTRFLDVERIATGRTYIDGFGTEQREYSGRFTVQHDGWIYIGIIAVIGIALLLMARQMYKKRNLEYAGDFMAVRWLEPVFQVIFTVLCAAGFHGVVGIFFGIGSDHQGFTMLSVGLIVGWFAGRMFLERTTRVFRLKNFAGFALMAALMFSSLYVTKLDPLGIEVWVPELDEIQSVSLRLSHRSDVSTEDPEEMAELIRLHKLALEERTVVHPDYTDDFYNPYVEDVAAYVTLSYKMNNGWFSSREYYILTEGEAGAIAQKYCSSLESVIDRDTVKDLDDLRHEMKRIDHITVSGHKIPEEKLTQEFLMSLADAIAADCETGAMVQSSAYHPVPVVDYERQDAVIQSLYLDMNGPDFFCYLNVYADCENTLAVLNSTGVVDLVRQEHAEYYGG